jgi:Nuclease-related domain
MTTNDYQLQGTGLQTASDHASYTLPGIPERLPPAASWRDRLTRWGLVRRTPKWPERPEVAGGERSERRVRALLKVHQSTTYGSIFGGKRVPRDMQAAAMGRFEIDLVVLTPRRVVALEVKNWSGRLRIDPQNPQRWIQDKRDGTSRSFDDPVAYNRDKLAALRSYLQHRGIDLPVQRFHQAVVLDNPWLLVDDSITRHPAVIVDKQLDVAVGKGTGISTVALAGLIQRFAKEEDAKLLTHEMLDVMTPAQKEAARTAISQLRTWDCLQLRGGRVLRGDLLWLRIGDQRLAATEFEPGAELAMRWCRDDTGWITVMLAGMAPGRAFGSALKGRIATRFGSVGVHVDDCVYFHEVGQAQPQAIALHAIDQVRVG